MTDEGIIIVGAGHAAAELAPALRREGFAGRITLIGEEPHLPYHRPPLSKAFLSGTVSEDGLLIKPAATYDKADVQVMRGVRVTMIDRTARVVTLDDGRRLAYSGLALTTGGRARRLTAPGAAQAEAGGVLHYPRSLNDFQRIRSQFTAGRRLVVIGGGYIGLEVAAAAVKQGIAVTILEAGPRVLGRVTAPEVSAFYETAHRQAGVDLRTGMSVTEILPASASAPTVVRCADGTDFPADLIIVGIGLEPNVELAQAAGLDVDNGILVDDCARTSDPAIVAAGDCANHPNNRLGRRLRLESVPNATEQARSAAASLCGRDLPYASIPWFWSEQYDLKLQTVGLLQGYDHVALRGDPAARSFVAFYLKDGRVIAADCISRPQDFVQCRRLVEAGVPVAAADLSDEGVALKSLFSAPTT